MTDDCTRDVPVDVRGYDLGFGALSQRLPGKLCEFAAAIGARPLQWLLSLPHSLFDQELLCLSHQ